MKADGTLVRVHLGSSVAIFSPWGGPPRILDCRPDVLVKGGDWPVERIVGAPETLARGGSVHSIPFEHQRSTTALLEKIRRL